jgi:hypothetical protein
MYSLKINNRIFDTVPASIEDVSIGRFIQLRNTELTNPLAVLHWALGEKVEFKYTKATESQIANIFSLVNPVIAEVYGFMQTKAKKDVPSSIGVLGRDIKLKKGLLNDLPYWPYVVAKSIIKEEAAKEVFDPTDRIPQLLAHYLYSEVTKRPYDEAAAEEFVEIINDLPMVQCIQLGGFFLRKLPGLLPSNKQR